MAGSEAGSPVSEAPGIPAVGTSSSLSGSSAQWWSPRFGYLPTRDAAASLTVDELEKALTDVKGVIDALVQESHMFAHYIRRVEAKDPTAFQTMVANPMAGLDRSVRQQRKKLAKQMTVEKVIRLTSEQKTDIAVKEIEHSKKQMARRKANSEAKVEMELAKDEEGQIRVEETRKMDFDFNREVIVGGVNRYTGRIMAERVVKYFDDLHKRRETLISKLQLRLSTMQQTRKKLDLQLQQKEDVGESMKAIDFEKLRIQNRDYQEQIDERIGEILKLKVVAGDAVHSLHSTRNEQAEVTAACERLTRLVAQRRELLQQLTKEVEKTRRESEETKIENLKLKTRSDDYRVPPVMNYITTSAETYEQQKRLESWQRKLHIAELAVKSQQQKERRLRRELEQYAAASHASEQASAWRRQEAQPHPSRVAQRQPSRGNAATGSTELPEVTNTSRGGTRGQHQSS